MLRGDQLSLQNAVCFIMLTCLGPVLFTFYTQSVLKLKKNNSGAKGLSNLHIIMLCGGGEIFNSKVTNLSTRTP